MQMMMKCVGQDKTKAAGNISGRFCFIIHPSDVQMPFLWKLLTELYY